MTNENSKIEKWRRKAWNVLERMSMTGVVRTDKSGWMRNTTTQWNMSASSLHSQGVLLLCSGIAECHHNTTGPGLLHTEVCHQGSDTGPDRPGSEVNHLTCKGEAGHQGIGHMGGEREAHLLHHIKKRSKVDHIQYFFIGSCKQ